MNRNSIKRTTTILAGYFSALIFAIYTGSILRAESFAQDVMAKVPAANYIDIDEDDGTILIKINYYGGLNRRD